MQRKISCVCPAINRTLRENKYFSQKLFCYYYRWNYSGVTKPRVTIANRSISTGNCGHSLSESKEHRQHDAVAASGNSRLIRPIKSSSILGNQNKLTFPTVGVVFDIDGVLVRGRKVIKSAKDAINKLETHKVPFMYLTNSGCETEEHKAQSLEKHLGIMVI